jgi:hypothetical protein
MQVASSEIVKAVGVGVGVGLSDAAVVVGAADSGWLSAGPHAVVARIEAATTAHRRDFIFPQSKFCSYGIE